MTPRIAQNRAKPKAGYRVAAALASISLASAFACGNAGPQGREQVSSTSQAVRLTAVAVSASSVEASNYAATMATDGDITTRWGSEWGNDNEWIMFDLGSSKSFDEITINWDVYAYATQYQIFSSDDGSNWTLVREIQDGRGCDTTDGSCPSDGSVPEDLVNIVGKGRYIKLQGLHRYSENYGYSIREFKVFYNGFLKLEAPQENVATVSSASSTKSAKRGSAYHLCGWSVSGGQNDVNAIKNNTAWTYNWSDHPGSCVSGSSDLSNGTLEFVPMAWGVGTSGSGFHIDSIDGNATDVSRDQMVSDIPSNAKYLLGFNEPNFHHQSNLTPKQAASHWADVEYVASKKGLQIVGPAVNYCSTSSTDNAGSCVKDESGVMLQPFAWLEHFYNECSSSGAAGHNCKIDYQAVHSYSWYGVWSVDPLRVKAGQKNSSKGHCSNHTKDADEDGTDCGGEDCVACNSWAKSMFAKQVWLTEFAPTTDDCKAADCSSNAQVAQAQSYINTFVDKNGSPTNFPSLENDAMVFRYAWFMPKISNITSLNADSLLTSSTSSPQPTTVGNTYFNAAFTGSVSCTPTTCAALGDNCGSVSDGCGGTLNCGSCTSPQTCGGGGTANVCGGGGGGSGPLSRTGWVGTGSPTNDPSSQAFDGNLGTRWDTGTGQSGGETFTVDMQSSQTFSSITLDANGGSNYAHGFKVDVSTDKSTWTNVYTTTSGSSLETATFSPVTARYIRITQTGSSSHWWSIYEMNVIH